MADFQAEARSIVKAFYRHGGEEELENLIEDALRKAYAKGCGDESVESALVELREMFPDHGVMVGVDVWDNLVCDQGGLAKGSHAFIVFSNNQKDILDNDFSGTALPEAMQKVREYKASFSKSDRGE